MKFTKQSRLKSFLEITGPTFSAALAAPLNGSIAANIEAYMAFLQGKGGQGGDRAHLWEINGARQCIFRKTPVVFDVGANVGHWSKTFFEAQPQATVFQIEPLVGCQNAIRARKLPNSILVPVALGAEEGTAKLLSPSSTSGIASFHSRNDSRWKDLTYEEIEVSVTTVPKLLDVHNIDFLDFMKMDIEGHELAVLQGAEEAFSRKKIGGLSFEFGPGNVNSRTMFIDFYELLSDHGFEVLRIRPGGGLIALPEYDEASEYYRGSCNYVARLKEHPFRN